MTTDRHSKIYTPQEAEYLLAQVAASGVEILEQANSETPKEGFVLPAQATLRCLVVLRGGRICELTAFVDLRDV